MKLVPLICLCVGLLFISIARAQLPTRQIEVSGTIADTQGEPIADAIVVESMAGDRSRESGILTTTSDSDGRYHVSVKDATPADYVKVYAPEFAIQSEKLPVTAEGDQASVDFVMSPAAMIRLRVLDRAGKPIAGARLAMVSRQAPAPYWVDAEDWEAFGLPLPTSDAEGWLEIPNQDGELAVDLKLEHPDFVYCSVKQVSPHDPFSEVVMQGGKQVQFRVRCESDPEAVEQARIVVQSSDESGHFRQTIRVSRDGVATATLADRHTTIRINHPTLYGQPWYFYRPASDDPMNFSLHHTGKARGRVVDQTSGDGVSGVIVHFAREHRVIGSGWTDDDGKYEVELPDLDFEVSVTSNAEWEGDGTRLAVEIEPGHTQSLEPLSVTPKLPVRGQVVTADGEPVENAIIVASFRDTPTLTDGQGRFNLQSRDLRFVQALDPYERRSVVVPASDGGPELKLVLAAEGSMLGLVTDQQGIPLTGIPVSLNARFTSGRSGIRTVFHRTTTRADGTFRFLGLTTGLTYQAEVKGKQRAVYSSGRTESGNRKEARAPSDLKPLKLAPSLLKEVRELVDIREESIPETLPSLESLTTWFGSEPLTEDHFRGKPVVLCRGQSSSRLAICDLAHKLYASRGLRVVAIGGGPVPREAIEELYKRTGYSFAFAVGDRSTGERFPLAYNKVVLYDTEGRFHSELGPGGIVSLRRYMLYEYESGE